MEAKAIAVLPGIFQQLAAFNYNKAKDLADKERSLLGSGTWAHFLSCLSQLAAVEKLYMNLNLVTNKGFLRRENSVKALYESLLTDLTDLESRASGSSSSYSAAGNRHLSMAGALGALGSIGSSRSASHSEDSVDGPSSGSGGTCRLLSNLCAELLSFIQARICLIKFYESCHRSNAPLDYSDLSHTVADVSATYAESLTQPLLSSLHANLKHECDVLYTALSSLHEMQKHNFLGALLLLNSTREALMAWQKLITCRENKKYSFSSTFLKSSNVPALFQWLWQMRTCVTAKFSLYFYNSLAHQTSLGDMKSLLAKQPVDYVAKLVSFHKRVVATSVCVVLETSGIRDYQGPGYHLHLQKETSPTIPPPPPPPPPKLSRRLSFNKSPKTFDRIFCYPLLANQSGADATQDNICWTSIEHYLTKLQDQLPSMRDSVRQVYHHQSGYTHYIHEVEPLICLVVSYDCHRTEKESLPVREFLNELSQNLNLTKLFASLKS